MGCESQRIPSCLDNGASSDHSKTLPANCTSESRSRVRENYGCHCQAVRNSDVAEAFRAMHRVDGLFRESASFASERMRVLHRYEIFAAAPMIGEE